MSITTVVAGIPSGATTATGLPGAASGAAQSSSGQGAGGQTFEAVLQARQSAGPAGAPTIASPAMAEVSGTRTTGVETAEAAEGRLTPDALLNNADQSVQRLEELLGELDSQGTFSPQQLLQMQIEVHQITLQLETTTKAVSQAVTNVRNLFQQQV